MELKKSLGVAAVFSIAAGAMISSGIFILPGLAYSLTGPAVFVAYLIAGILGLIGVLSVLELATAMPRAGGDYFYITRSMGPFMGTLSGFLSWFALSLKSAFAVWGMAAVTLSFFSLGPGSDGYSAYLTWLSLGYVVIFVGVNLAGVKEAAVLETILVVILIALMLLFIGFGLPSVNIGSFEPFIKITTLVGDDLTTQPAGLVAILSTAAFVFISFGGLLKAASIGEEVINPSRNLPRGMLGAIGAITVLYVLIVITTVGILPAKQLITTQTPVADVARITMGKAGYIAISVAAFLAFVTTANAGIMAASRYPLALARDGLGPAFISKVSKNGTPWLSIVATGVFIALSLLLELSVLVKVASSIILISYVLSSLSVIILRESQIQNYRPSFKSPFYPWVQVFSIIVFSLMIVDMSIASLKVSLVWLYLSLGLILTSVVFYLIFGRRSGQDYALLHLIERITNKQLAAGGLEDELKQIIRTRDEVVADDFDNILEKAEVIDIEQSLPLEGFFARVAPAVAARCHLDAPTVLKLMQEREQQSSTAISNFVAIPHIIMPGNGVFEVVVIRSRQGVAFGPDSPSIKAVFVIIGTLDKRNLHLRALAAIAQIVQSHSFSQRWQKSRNANQLRDVLLLGKRKRG